MTWMKTRKKGRNDILTHSHTHWSCDCDSQNQYWWLVKYVIATDPGLLIGRDIILERFPGFQEREVGSLLTYYKTNTDLSVEHGGIRFDIFVRINTFSLFSLINVIIMTSRVVNRFGQTKISYDQGCGSGWILSGSDLWEKKPGSDRQEKPDPKPTLKKTTSIRILPNFIPMKLLWTKKSI